MTTTWTTTDQGRDDDIDDGDHDAVVDDVDLVRIEVEEAQEVGFRLLGDGDDSVGHFERGAFEPDGEVVAVAELLALPGAQRLEGVDGEHHGHAVVELGEDAAEVRIPGV